MGEVTSYTKEHIDEMFAETFVSAELVENDLVLTKPDDTTVTIPLPEGGGGGAGAFPAGPPAFTTADVPNTWSGTGDTTMMVLGDEEDIAFGIMVDGDVYPRLFYAGDGGFLMGDGTTEGTAEFVLGYDDEPTPDLQFQLYSPTNQGVTLKVNGGIYAQRNNGEVANLQGLVRTGDLIVQGGIEVGMVSGGDILLKWGSGGEPSIIKSTHEVILAPNNDEGGADAVVFASNADFKAGGPTKGLILTSPGATDYRVKVNNAGTLTVTAV